MIQTTAVPGIGQRAWQWWAALADPNETRGGRDRATLAQLRRCHVWTDAIMHPAGIDLVRRLAGAQARDGTQVMQAAILAIVLAHVREDAPGKRIARAIGRSGLNDEESALVSEARFRRLMLSRTPEELLGQMTRLARLMKGAVNVNDMSESIFFWSDRKRRDWAFDYYAAGAAKPHEDTNNHNNEATNPGGSS